MPKEGYSSLFAYIKDKFNYSGSSAYRRIQMARLSRRFPEIMDLLISGRLNLLSICLIEPHMTFENGKGLIQQAIGKTKEEIEYLLANQFPKIEKTEDKIRRLPVIKKVVSVEQIKEVKLECVVDEKVAKKLERAKDLLRTKFPKGRLEDILNEALDSLLDKKDPERKIERIQKKGEHKKEIGQKKQLKSRSRYIPSPLKQEIWKRDQGTCTFISPSGKRCGERGNLHMDHVRPFALGGETNKENLRLLCRTHNLFRAQQTFGISQRQ